MQIDLDGAAHVVKFTVESLNIPAASKLQLFRTDTAGTVISDGSVQSFSLLASDSQLVGFTPQFTIDDFLNGENSSGCFGGA